MLQCDIFTYYVSVLIHSFLCLLIMWNLFMCSLDHCRMYYNCSILLLASCVGEVCWDLFHDEFIDYSPCFLIYGLDHCSYGLGPKEREVLCQCFVYDPCLLYHGDRFQRWHDIQLDGSTLVLRWVAVVVHIFPVVEYVQWAFLVCERHVVCACDRWWLFPLLWQLCLGHMGIDLLCCLSGLCLSWGLFKLNW
jgi:hypothetical protein